MSDESTKEFAVRLGYITPLPKIHIDEDDLMWLIRDAYESPEDKPFHRSEAKKRALAWIDEYKNRFAKQQPMVKA